MASNEEDPSTEPAGSDALLRGEPDYRTLVTAMPDMIRWTLPPERRPERARSPKG